MPERDRLPPPTRGTERDRPDMAGGSVGDMMMRLASRDAGMEGGMGGGDEQAAQLVLQGAQMLWQAAQLDPNIAPIIQQAIETLRSGMAGMAGGAPGMERPPATERPARPRRPKRPRAEEAETEEGSEFPM